MTTTRRVLAGVGIAAALALTVGAIAYAVTTGSGERTMVGAVVAANNVALSVQDQPGAAGTLTVANVKVPGPSWIVVHLDEGGKPGMRIGLQAVPSGETADVKVALESADLTDKLIVAVHADRGVPDTFDFAMDRFESSPDKPYFVDGKEMATEVRVK